MISVRYLSGNLKHFRELDAHFGSLRQLSARFRMRSTYFSAKVSNREFSISDFLLRRLGSNLSETGSITKANVTEMVFHQMGEEGEKRAEELRSRHHPNQAPKGMYLSAGDLRKVRSISLPAPSTSERAIFGNSSFARQ